MEGPARERVRFNLTRSESRALIGLAIILLIGLIGQQVKRYLERDPGTLVIEGATPLVEQADTLAHGAETNASFDSPRLDGTTSENVTSTPKPSSGSMPPSGTLPHGSETEAQDLAGRSVERAALEESVLAPEEVSDKSPALLDLNRARQEELQALPGIGPVISSRIVAWREKHGPFNSVDDLLLVKGIGEVRLEKLRVLVTVYP
ncbi:helix-hairpin-helix domain-containing protein [bacterium]|nr:helix-hairpin-helix domain-containing protein [bacterium]